MHFNGKKVQVIIVSGASYIGELDENDAENYYRLYYPVAFDYVIQTVPVEDKATGQRTERVVNVPMIKPITVSTKEYMDIPLSQVMYMGEVADDNVRRMHDEYKRIFLTWKSGITIADKSALEQIAKDDNQKQKIIQFPPK